MKVRDFEALIKTMDQDAFHKDVLVGLVSNYEYTKAFCRGVEALNKEEREKLCKKIEKIGISMPISDSEIYSLIRVISEREMNY